MMRIDYTALCVSLFVIIGTVPPQATQAQSVFQRGGLGLPPVTLSSSDLGDIDDDGDQDLVVTGLKNGTFGNTGLDINFSGTNGSGTVVVKKMDTPPNGRPGISETNVSAYRFVVDAESGLSFDDMTTLHFDVSTLDGINDASQVSV